MGRVQHAGGAVARVDHQRQLLARPPGADRHGGARMAPLRGVAARPLRPSSAESRWSGRAVRCRSSVCARMCSRSRARRGHADRRAGRCCVLGPAVTRVLALPSRSCVHVPVPAVVVNTVALAQGDGGGAFDACAELLGVTLQRRGMTLFLASGELRMENPCSGCDRWSGAGRDRRAFRPSAAGRRVRRAMMLVAAVPIAMLGNAVR